MENEKRTAAKIWFCKIGEVDSFFVPKDSDWPMRQAVAKAYLEVTGHDAAFCFSGWNGKLTEPERAVVENRLPSAAYQSEYAAREQLVKDLVAALEAIAKGDNIFGPMQTHNMREIARAALAKAKGE